jgi:hypothetical protein
LYGAPAIDADENNYVPAQAAIEGIEKSRRDAEEALNNAHVAKS